MKKIFSFFSVILLCILVSGCAGGFSDLAEKGNNMLKGEELELKYATQFSVSTYEDGCALIRIGDGLNYILVPEDMDIPEWQDDIENCTIVRTPLSSIYLAASSAMDLFDALDALDRVTMTSTKESDWGIEGIKEMVASEDILYVGKYSAPDYEALLFQDCDFAIESTMIYHNPEVKESIEALGIPVMVERSSYEAEPLGRLEWIKLYGLLMGREEEAAAFFDRMEEKLNGVLEDTEKLQEGERPEVAFFSISANNYATVRKPGDYISRMIYMAGGEYSMKDLPVADENALSTTNIQLESFYDYVVDAVFLIYNSAIQGEINTRAELLDKFGELKNARATEKGNLWCTNKNVFQKSSGVAEMTEELYLIISGKVDGDEGLEYFHKLD